MRNCIDILCSYFFCMEIFLIVLETKFFYRKKRIFSDKLSN